MLDFNIYSLISGQIKLYKEKKINEVDLYNSIINLIWNSMHDSQLIDKREMEKVIQWLSKEEEALTPPAKQYRASNVIKNAGNNYFEGLKYIFSIP